MQYIITFIYECDCICVIHNNLCIEYIVFGICYNGMFEINTLIRAKSRSNALSVCVCVCVQLN